MLDVVRLSPVFFDAFHREHEEFLKAVRRQMCRVETMTPKEFRKLLSEVASIDGLVYLNRDLSFTSSAREGAIFVKSSPAVDAASSAALRGEVKEFSVASLLAMFERGAFVFSEEEPWTDVERSRFIESVISGASPVLSFVQRDEDVFKITIGVNALKSLYDFVVNLLPCVSDDGSVFSFLDLPREVQDQFVCRSFRAEVYPSLNGLLDGLGLALKGAFSQAYNRAEIVEVVLSYHLEKCVRQLVSFWSDSMDAFYEDSRLSGDALFLCFPSQDRVFVSKEPVGDDPIFLAYEDAFPFEDPMKTAMEILLAALKGFLGWSKFSTLPFRKVFWDELEFLEDDAQ